VKQFGYDRLRYFQPLRSIFEAGGLVGGGSDTCRKWVLCARTTPTTRSSEWRRRSRAEHGGTRGSSIPRNPFPESKRSVSTPSTTARILFLDEVVGSLEPGKLADLVVLDRDLLTCPEDQIASTQVLRTYFSGKLVYQRQ